MDNPSDDEQTFFDYLETVDIDALFQRLDDKKDTPQDHEIFDGAMLKRFIECVHSDEPVEPFIMNWLANAFVKILMGGVWNDEISLPGHPRTEIWTSIEKRGLEIYCQVSNAIQDGDKITAAIQNAADDFCVSYETARADYYRWKKRLSKNSPKT